MSHQEHFFPERMPAVFTSSKSTVRSQTLRNSIAKQTNFFFFQHNSTLRECPNKTESLLSKQLLQNKYSQNVFSISKDDPLSKDFNQGIRH